MSQGGWPWHSAGLSRPAQGRAPGGAGAWPSLARRARPGPGQLCPGRSGPVMMTPGSGGAWRPREGGRSRPTPLAPRVRPPEAHGRLLPAAAAAPCGAGDVRGPPRRPGAPPSRVGIPRAELGAGPRGAQKAAARDEAGGLGLRARRTMRPAHNPAVRVGQGGARVAECVCVRLSVNADRPQPIGQVPPASPPTATAHWAV